MSEPATNLDDPERLHAIRWATAIQQWQRGDAEPLRALVAELPAPDFVREFLGDLVAGRVERPKGRPAERSGGEEFALVIEVHAAWDATATGPKSRGDAGPRDRAIAEVATHRGLSPEALRGIVQRHCAEGFTRTLWRARKREFATVAAEYRQRHD